MNVVILGAGGFVGSHLVEHLLSHSPYSIVGLDVASDKLAGVSSPRFTFHEEDVRLSPSLLDRIVASADVVIDLIAYANPSMYVSSPLEVFDLNFMQNLEIARACIRHRKRLIQYSSAEVYGKNVSGESYNEETTDCVFGPVNKQRWIYANAKLLLDRVIHAHGMEGDLDFTIIRPFNFIGPRIDYLVPPGSMGGPRVFAHFMSALLADGPIFLVDGGEVHRAFLHIDDASRALQMVLEQPEASRNQIYNVGNPANNITIRELAVLMRRTFEEIMGRPSRSELVDVPGEVFYGAGYEDADRLPPDIGKICSLGWAPRHDLAETVRHTMQYYLTGEGRDTPIEPVMQGANLRQIALV